jgi:hypothetical protein
MRARPSITKRAREKERAERKRDKAEKREVRKEERSTRPENDSDEDPDIAGIKPGPQPLDPDLFGPLAERDH